MRKISGKLIENSKLDYDKARLKNIAVILAYELDLQSQMRVDKPACTTLESWLSPC
jgi:hypothetical protein